MSLAPASSRGAFLNARLAVNGIQCAARSLGTLTAADRGLLSSMGWPLHSECDGCPAGYQLHRATGTLQRAYISANPAVSRRFAVHGRVHKSRAAIQNTSPSESSVSSHNIGVFGNAASSAA